MKPRININKIWFDEDITELKIEVCDGSSIFYNDVYIGNNEIEQLITDLTAFREQVHGGLYDIKFGEFGPEYGNGGFQARLHFKVTSKLHISTYQQSDFNDFKNLEVASEAKMFLVTEPVLLDNFISELKSLKSGSSDEASLMCAI